MRLWVSAQIARAPLRFSRGGGGGAGAAGAGVGRRCSLAISLSFSASFSSYAAASVYNTVMLTSRRFSASLTMAFGSGRPGGAGGGCVCGTHHGIGYCTD